MEIRPDMDVAPVSGMSDQESRRKRTVRSRIIYSITIVGALVIIVNLLIFLRPLLLPVVLGILAAYLCQPLLNLLYRNGVPRGISVMILLGGFLLTVFMLARYVVDLIPDDMEQLQYKVSVQENINDRYQYYMGLSEEEEGNFIYSIFGPELDPLMDSANQWLQLTPAEQEMMSQFLDNYGSDEFERLRDAFANQQTRTLYTDPDVLVSERLLEISQDDKLAETQDEGESSLILSTLNVLSIWLVMPVMFLFFLMDTGQIRKGFVALVPNNYFEMSLTVLNNVDRAIGNYLRGTLIETLLMTLTVWVLLVLIGFDIRIAFFLSLLSGIANIIPIFGMFIGIGVCVIYALIAEDVSSILPFINLENLVIWTVIAHIIAQAIDNAVFKPFILGRAVALHPITVFLGAIAGSMLFGFVGLLFAIPAIVVFKEIFSTFFKEMKAYFLIY